MEETATTTLASGPVEKISVLNVHQYNQIRAFIRKFEGLAMHCGVLMVVKHFKHVKEDTLKSILRTDWINWMRTQHLRYAMDAGKYLRLYEAKVIDAKEPNVLIEIATENRISPVELARIIIGLKFATKDRDEIEFLLQNRRLLKDKKLANNMTMCLLYDTVSGPMMDYRMNFMDREYVEKSKVLAREANIAFFETMNANPNLNAPSLKMRVPFLYKNTLINWIQSKACFGDTKTHRAIVQNKLKDFTQVFGSGMIIYWHGHQIETAELVENVGILVVDEFPQENNLMLLSINIPSDDDEGGDDSSGTDDELDTFRGPCRADTDDENGDDDALESDTSDEDDIDDEVVEVHGDTTDDSGYTGSSEHSEYSDDGLVAEGPQLVGGDMRDGRGDEMRALDFWVDE